MPDKPKVEVKVHENVESEIGDFLESHQEAVEEEISDDEFFGRQPEENEEGEDDSSVPPVGDDTPATDDKDEPIIPAASLDTDSEPESEPEPEASLEATPPVDDPLAELRAQNELLLKRIEELTGAEPPAPKPTEATAAPTAAAPAPQQGDVFDFIGDADVDDIVADKNKLNAILSKVLNTAINSSTENLLRAMPQVVQSQVKRQAAFQEYVDAFYKDHEDLMPVKKTVGHVANTVHSEHPDWTIEQVFEETAIRTRTMLGLKAKVASSAQSSEPQTPPAAKPALPVAPNGGARQQRTQLTGQAKHIADVL